MLSITINSYLNRMPFSKIGHTVLIMQSKYLFYTILPNIANKIIRKYFFVLKRPQNIGKIANAANSLQRR